MRAHLAILALPLLFVAGCNAKGNDANADQPKSVAAVAPPAGQHWNDVVSETPEGGYLMGNPNAPIKLIEYGSRTCPHCARFHEESTPQLETTYVGAGKVSYEFRDYPVHAALDMAPILLGRCVAPSSFFAILGQMMSDQQQFLDQTKTLNQSKIESMSPSQVTIYLAEQLGYLDFVKARGIPDGKARACLADKASIDAIAQQTQAASQQYNISGTPTFVLNGVVLDNVGEWSQVESRLKAAGA